MFLLSPSLLAVQKYAPVVHCITNMVTVNDCANIILAAGGSPTMSRNPKEVSEITSGCHALMLNMGTVSDTEAMLRAGETANALGHPIILDPVGVGASQLRRDTAAQLIERLHPTVIRGNASEIRSLLDGGEHGRGGVDAALEDKITPGNVRKFGALASALSERLRSIICISGAIDLAAWGSTVYAFPGGSPLMSRITGTGCMLTALMGAYLGGAFAAQHAASGSGMKPQVPAERFCTSGSAPGELHDQPGGSYAPGCSMDAKSDPVLSGCAADEIPNLWFPAVIAAQAAMNAAGDIAAKKTAACGGGTMTFRLHLIDAISLMNGETLDEQAKVERL